MKRTLLTIAGTLVITSVVVAAGAYAFVNSGIYDVSATTPHSRMMYWATHQTMEHSVGRRMDANVVPAGLDLPTEISAGAALYVENCVTCHGSPDRERSAISQGLNPQPPDLFSATREPDPAENFQFIKYGVKMTGMPGFAGTQTDEQIWALVAFLNTTPGQTAVDFAHATGIRPTSRPSDLPNQEN
ncbi:cytochrome c [Roseovarius aestuarii]|nr:cytochrome c [Roseovarius aestuarii]